jgi:hypothetical protein
LAASYWKEVRGHAVVAHFFFQLDCLADQLPQRGLPIVIAPELDTTHATFTLD